MTSTRRVTPAGRLPAGFRAVWSIARAAAWVFYRVERLGPPLPDGPVLVVANHPNALLDPALVASTAGRPLRFLAKSTLVSGSPISPLIRAAGAIPVHRRHDPGVDPSKNAEMFAAVGDVLARGEVVCLFPEGISHSTGHLEPLKTGAARIALDAAARGIPVTIVAAGLNFDRKAVFRSRAVVAFGPGFGCAHHVDAYHADPPGAVRTLTDEIARHLRDLLVEADPETEAGLVARVDRLYASARQLPRTADAKLARRRVIAAGLDALREKDPERLGRLADHLRAHERRLARFGLDPRSVGPAADFGTVIRFTVRETVLALVLLPVAALGLAVFAVPYSAVHAIAGREGISLDMRATWKIGAGVATYGAWLGLIVTATSLLLGGPAAVAVAIGLPVLAVGSLLAIERETEVAAAVRSHFLRRRIGPRAAARFRREQEALADLLDETHRWLTALEEDAGGDARA